VTAPNPDVSAQSPPPEAQDVFGDRFELAQRYAALLCDAGVTRGLIGPREPGRIWTRHLLNGAWLAPWVPHSASVFDVGSGAGLPGIPLLLARPDLRLTLVEPMARRVAFCEETRTALGLDFEIVRARGEQAPRSAADVVVARALAPLDRLVGLTVPLLRPGGRLLALKGDRAGEEVAEASAVLARVGISTPEIHSIGVGEDRTFVVEVVRPDKAIR
jgi:16S rRNA (guanine527-N7)-methyltransferase